MSKTAKFVSTPEVETPKIPLGESPAALAKRDLVKPNNWCPKQDIEFDAWCDPDNPKTVTYKDVAKATAVIREEIPRTPLVRSRCCVQFGLEMNYKLEIFHRTGSFCERGALYSLLMLNDEQRIDGVITASLGNWGKALAYQGQKLSIPVTVVFPVNTMNAFVEKCQDYGAAVVLHGNNLAEAKRQAFIMIAGGGKFSYINGYDHPHVIAGAGTIAMEILVQLPQTEAIIVPIGGGALIAGISTVIKQVNPDIQIYGVETDKCSCFFKAMENERPYQTNVPIGIANSLGVPTAGHNAFHTAKSHIDKMVLVDDDWIARGILHLIEEEKIIAEGAGAAALGAFLSVPHVLPELRNKTVVCIISGGNIDHLTLPRSLERAKAIEGRLIKLTITLPAEGIKEQLKVFSIVANVGCNVIRSYIEPVWLEECDLENIYFTLICETTGLEHACTLKRVMEQLFPNICNFLEEPFSPIPICACFPKRIPN